jgi:hypothetical protein
LGRGGAETHVLSPEAGGKRRLMKTVTIVQMTQGLDWELGSLMAKKMAQY